MGFKGGLISESFFLLCLKIPKMGAKSQPSLDHYSALST